MSHFQIVFYSFILILLIGLTAFFACAETAVMAINRYRIRHKAHEKKRFAIRLLNLLKRPDRLLGAILIGSTFTNILASSLATLIAYHFLGEEGAILSAVLLTFVILIFAEITPKTIAAIYPEKIVRWAIYPIEFFLKILYPVVLFANFITSILLKAIHIHIPKSQIDPLSRDELRIIVSDAASHVSRQYQNMLLGILDLNKLIVDDLMIPRHELTGLDIDDKWEKIQKELLSLKEDWLIVYRENMNQLVGILYARNLINLFLTHKKLTKEILQQYIQEPYYVPEGASLHTQLNYFQKHHQKIAFIVDEYGEILGMITLNNILEEIVGDFTSNVSNIKKLGEQKDGSYLVEGTMTVREFNRLTSFDLPTRGPRTLNGLIVEYLQSLPRTGTALLIAGYPIEIIEVKENRVKTAKVFPKLK